MVAFYSHFHIQFAVINSPVHLPLKCNNGPHIRYTLALLSLPVIFAHTKRHTIFHLHYTNLLLFATTQQYFYDMLIRKLFSVMALLSTTFVTARPIGDNGGTTSVSGTDAKQAFGNSKTDGDMSPQL